MADFRKWLLVIAVALLCAATASAASQPVNIQCGVNAQPQDIRNGGVTEPIREVDLTCDATQVTAVPSIRVQLVLSVNTTVTNAIVANGTGDGLGPISMAAAVVQYSLAPQSLYTPPSPYLNPVQGRIASNFGNVNNAVKFPHVVVPMGTTFTVRLVNVRVDALALTNAFGGTTVLGQVAANTEDGTGYGLALNGQTGGPEGNAIAIAFVQDTYTFAVTDCTGVTPLTATIQFQQCIDYFLAERGTGIGTSGIQVYGVKFTELQQTAFKNIVEEDGLTIPSPGQLGGNNLICDTGHEGTGYEAVIDDTVPPLGVPTCDDNPAFVSNGTRLLAQFTVRPDLVGKIHIWVSQQQAASKSGAAATLATVSSPLGWGNNPGSPSEIDVLCSKAVGGAEDNVWVQLPDGATETATWEVTHDNQGGIDDLTFDWTITYRENQLPPVGANTTAIALTGNIAPVSNETVFGPALITAEPVVRFSLPPQNGTVSLAITDCVTNILYPYVTNIVGFETGIAVANTSLDTAWNLTTPPSAAQAGGVVANWGTLAAPLPYNTTPQSGPCNLYLFGSSAAQNMAGAGTAVQAIASATTPSVAAGQVFADTMTNIFALSAGKTPVTMSGYVIARCQFQFGHGYAYLVSPGGVPQSYLALVIPDRSVLNGFAGIGPLFESTPVRVAVPFSNAILDEQGEMLAQ